jgi:hypothetical protein
MYIPHVARGFTCADLRLLTQTCTENMAKSVWGTAYFVHDPDLECVAIWAPHSTLAQSPMLSISRFRRTGTYAAISGAHVIATAKTLEDVLKSLGLFGGDDTLLQP